MVQITTSPAEEARTEPTPRRPTMVFHRGATIVRALPEGKGWRVEGDDPALVARITAALKRPMKTRVSREAVDEVSGAFQIESWMVELQPDDPRYGFKVAHGVDRVGLQDVEFDDIELKVEV